MDKKIVWLVLCTESPTLLSWAGIFTTKEKALEICKDFRFYLGPIELDKYEDELKPEWVGSYQPNATETPEALAEYWKDSN